MCCPRRAEIEKRDEDWEENRKVRPIQDDTPEWIRKIQDQATPGDDSPDLGDPLAFGKD